MPKSNAVTVPFARDAVLDSDIRCQRVELKSIDDLTVRSLFSGFDTLRAITFSASAGFVDRIIGLFEYSEIIIGAEFLVRRNACLHDAMYQALAASDLSREIPGKYANIGDRMRSGSLLLKASNICLDHRKLYILSSRDGRTRVITASANMSGRAWSGEHLEFYMYDDTRGAYDYWLAAFDAAWSMSGDVPYQVAGAGDGGLLDGNVVIRKSIEVNNMLVVPAQEEAVTKEMIQYVVRHEDLADEYAGIFRDVIPRGKSALKGGLIRILPAGMEKARKAQAMLQERRKVELAMVDRDYPRMQFVYDREDPAMSLNDKPVGLNPDEAGVRRDIDTLMTVFGHFDDGGEFIGNLAGLRENHYKFLIYMLMAPHVARLRCAAYFNGITETSLPLFAVLTSRQPNTGKTFMADAILRLMTGLDISGAKGEGKGVSELIRDVQISVKCTPYLFDEVSSQSFSKSIKKEVKNADFCERGVREQQPVIVFTSNEMADPDDVVRKRSIHLLFDAALRSDVDQNAFRNQGNRLKKRFTGAFYREFTRRIVPWVAETLEYMNSDGDRPDTWYPDVVAASSRVFLEILADFGYDAPAYMRRLTWNDDYFAVRKAAENTISEIQEQYEANPDIFTFGSRSVSVNLGSDPGKQKLMKSWYNTLPPEVKADCYSSVQTGSVLTMDLRELERLGFRRKGLRFRGFPFPWRRGRRA